jgi:hypothetical protein
VPKNDSRMEDSESHSARLASCSKGSITGSVEVAVGDRIEILDATLYEASRSLSPWGEGKHRFSK